jgi:uncharacterized surface protein with fasciclin (FAS1) repeats
MRRFLSVGLAITAIVGLSPSLGLADCGKCDGEKKACHAEEGARCCGTCGKEKPKDIVDTAVGAGNFKTLAAALKAADLVTTLKGEGPYTVFAPTDEAFARLPKGTIQELLKPENRAKLAAILTYHVVPGDVRAGDVVKLAKAKTVQGSSVKIKVNKQGKVLIDRATVTATDILCSNGVIHVIDSVILPN